MDKQKQIEEMAKDICEDCSFPTCVPNKTCDSWIYAKNAVEQGYRKIPENAVVLTREEYDELTTSEIGELVKENQELGRQCVDWSELYRKKVNQLKQARKETAEKFAKRLKNQSDFFLNTDEKGNMHYVDFAVWIDEIAKEITGE